MEDTSANHRTTRCQEGKQTTEKNLRKYRGKYIHPSYCIVTVLPMSANLRSSKIKKLYLSAIFKRIKQNEQWMAVKSTKQKIIGATWQSIGETYSEKQIVSKY